MEKMMITVMMIRLVIISMLATLMHDDDEETDGDGDDDNDGQGRSSRSKIIEEVMSRQQQQ
jgi:hypothetical protein